MGAGNILNNNSQVTIEPEITAMSFYLNNELYGFMYNTGSLKPYIKSIDIDHLIFIPMLSSCNLKQELAEETVGSYSFSDFTCHEVFREILRPLYQRTFKANLIGAYCVYAELGSDNNTLELSMEEFIRAVRFAITGIKSITNPRKLDFMNRLESGIYVITEDFLYVFVDGFFTRVRRFTHINKPLLQENIRNILTPYDSNFGAPIPMETGTVCSTFVNVPAYVDERICTVSAELLYGCYGAGFAIYKVYDNYSITGADTLFESDKNEVFNEWHHFCTFMFESYLHAKHESALNYKVLVGKDNFAVQNIRTNVYVHIARGGLYEIGLHNSTSDFGEWVGIAMKVFFNVVNTPGKSYSIWTTPWDIWRVNHPQQASIWEAWLETYAGISYNINDNNIYVYESNETSYTRRNVMVVPKAPGSNRLFLNVADYLLKVSDCNIIVSYDVEKDNIKVQFIEGWTEYVTDGEMPTDCEIVYENTYPSETDMLGLVDHLLSMSLEFMS